MNVKVKILIIDRDYSFHNVIQIEEDKPDPVPMEYQDHSAGTNSL